MSLALKPHIISDPRLNETVPRRVLVVDDSRMQRRILTAQLSRSGYEVIEAASAEEALPICAKCEPDIVISDWMMAGMNGPDFCRAFRQMTRSSYGYFILLTSKTDKTDVSHGLESGADDFLSKPVNGEELRARLVAGRRILAMQEELSAKNALLRASQDAIERDLQEARKLQQSLVRERHRSFGSAEVALMLRPAGHVGGDLVGFFPINARRVGLYGIDVSGHGITSAVMMARLAGYLSGAMPAQNIAMVESEFGIYEGRPPAELAEMLNELVLEEMQTESYFTLVYSDIDLVTGRVELVQAGHPYPVVQRQSGDIEFLGEGGLPVGLIPGARYRSINTVLAPGDRLILLSDGMTEATNRAGKMIDHAGLSAIFTKFAQLRGRAFLDAVFWDLENYTDAQMEDDVSAVIFSFDGAKMYRD
ncbi:SpoIIE family protein phosphatase [uncultured Thioclava sp.]|uniref:PP2C family protein-serine/threonine phosphatase n=1 Tax=uncultured Thioclava sp. TaxID=473858 RepID=UPI0025FB0201|nr:SpoIIE family protein phosphatase [uncultured Thioclava sp.]